MERKILLLGLLFSLFFTTQVLAQPSCGGNTPPGGTTATFTDLEVGSSFTATTDCLGVLDEIEIKVGPGGGNNPAELRIYEGLIGMGEVLIFSQQFTVTPGDNMISLIPSPGNPVPCLSQGGVYTFTIQLTGGGNITLQGYNTNNYPDGAIYTTTGGYDPNGDTFFSFTGTDDGEIDIQGQGISIMDGDLTPDLADGTDFGVVTIGNTQTNTFTILNTGTEDILLTGTPYVQLSGDPEFSVATQPAAGTIPPGGSLTFSITYTPAANGVVSTASVIVPNTDCNEELYTFQIQGEAFECIAPDIPTLETSENNVCPNTTVTLSVIAGNLNGAADWYWYDDVCGGNLIGTGSSIMVMPMSTTTYYARGEGGCVIPGDCAEITVTIEDLEDPVITCPDPFTLEVDGACEALIPDLTLLQTTVLASSIEDFSGTQGQDGWNYGYYPPADPAAFTELDPANFSMNTWFGAQTGNTPYLDPQGGYPGVDDGVWAVRRWVSDHTGFVTISLDYFDRDINCGDGANVRLYHNGTEVFSELAISDIPSNSLVDLFVLPGDEIDLIIDPIADTDCDDTELTAEITVNSGLIVTDNCDLSFVTITQDPVAGTVVGEGITTVTLTATDGFGNSAVCTVDLTFEDNIPPTAVCQDVTVELAANGIGSTTPGAVNNGSSDNCGIASLSLDEENFTCADVGPNTVTLTVTDDSGNSSTCMATVTVEDNVPPVAVCQDVMLVLDPLGFGSITPGQVDGGSTDACGIPSLSLDKADFGCEDVGQNTVTLTVTDANGNSSTCTATVTVVDDDNITALCQDITVQLDATGNATIVPQDIDNGSFDACGIDNLSLDQTAFDCSHVGLVNTVTLTVTDVNGNSATCTATVTVEDNVAPEALCQDVTVELDDTGNGSITPAEVDNGSTDACGIASLSLDQTAFDCSDVDGMITVTLTVTDVNGNSSTCTATVTVEDNVAPEALCQDVTVQLDATGNGSTTAAAIDNGSNDACGIASLSLDQTAFDCGDVGLNTVTLTVTDVNGNSSTCTATVTVEDNIAPEALCQDVTVQLDATGNGSTTAAAVDNGSNDACGIGSLSLDQTAFDCGDVGLNTVTLTVTDVNGNSATCTATVTVEDNVAPEALCQDVTVELDAMGNGSITAAEVDNGSTDACGIASLNLDQTAFDCSDVDGMISVTLTVTDVNGNSSTCTAAVTVEDNVAPEALCQDVTLILDPMGFGNILPEQVDNGSTDACGIAGLSLDEDDFSCADVGPNTVTLTVTDVNGNSSTCTATVTVVDDDDLMALCQDITIQLDAMGNASITPEEIDNGSSDACGVASLSLDQTDFDCSHVGLMNTVTLTVTDVNGNSATCTAVVTVEDNVAPETLCQDVTVELDVTGNGSTTAAEVDNGSTDACGIASLSLDQTAFDCSDVGGMISVTLTVTDVNGNSDTCSAIVTVLDLIAPEALCQPVLVELDTMGNGSITPGQVDNGSNDACGIATVALDQTDFDCGHVGANTVTLTVTDVNGNSSTCTATVTVEDNTVPEALCQDVTVELDATGNVLLTPAQVNDGSNDACGIATLELDQTAFTCADLGPNTVTLTVTDANGNSSTCMATVTVEDNVAPDALCQDITIQLDLMGVYNLDPQEVDGGSTDNCPLSLSFETDITTFTCEDIGYNTVTLTVTDGSGNSDVCSATVTVLASEACPVPDIRNYDGPNVSDPCTCLSDGWFAEEIVIGPTLPGMQWTVSVNNGLLNDPVAQQLFPAGTIFTEVPQGMGQSIYVLPGVHFDAIGYSLEAVNVLYPDVTLSIGNTCYYPDPVIIGLNDQYCLSSNPVPLEGEAGGVMLVSETFTINGIPAMVFDPAALGVGFHTVEYTVDAGPAGSNDPADPGCVASDVQVVEVTTASTGAMVCNDLVLVSVDENCEALITPDMVLEGSYFCYDDFEVEIYYFVNQLPNPVPGTYIGLTLNYTVVNLNNWNSCSGLLILSDQWEPEVFCEAEPVVLSCTDDLSDLPDPLAWDNCSLASVDLVSQTFLDTDECDDGKVVVQQVWIATDAYGNESEPCTRLIEILRTANDMVDFPNDITWECSQYDLFANLIDPVPLHPNVWALQDDTNDIDATVLGLQPYLAATGSGIPGNIQGTYCGYSFFHTDQILEGCGTSFQIVRTWSVLDACTGQLITENVWGEDNVQIISVVDATPPVVTVPDFTLSANIPGSGPGTCKSTGLLPPPVVTDNCNTWEYRIFTPIGEAIYLPNGWASIPMPGLGLGTHIITYQVMDVCGNTTTVEVEVEVVDDIPPTVICDEITDVNLSSDGLAIVNAMTFDDGSFDNCCVGEFLVRRLDGDCDGNFDDFGPTVTFCCEDVENNPVFVVLRVVDCFGNYNECTVEVLVNDKIFPQVMVCPPSVQIDCDTYNENYMMPLSLGDGSVLDDFGTASFFDNCLSTLNVDYSYSVSVDNCGNGSILRQWLATDDSGNGPVTCKQLITVLHLSDWVVEFPANVMVECTAGQLPDTGEPQIFFDDCELIATSYTDQVFNVVPDACYKIERTWTVINWCIFEQYGSNIYSESGYSEANLSADWNGNGVNNRTFRDGYNSSGTPGTPDGYITWKQTIKVVDEDDPVFTVPAIDGCIVGTSCVRDIVLPYPVIMDACSPQFKVTLTGDFGTFADISGSVTIPDIGVGEYEVTYAVADNCGNTAYQLVSIQVEDCKKPTPLCDDDLVVEIMQTQMVTVPAEAFDEGSWDNCGPIVHWSYSPDVTDTELTFTCADLGGNLVEIWVTDIYGNQDYCEVVLTVQDNMGHCDGGTIIQIAGMVATEDDEPVEGVSVELSGGLLSQITGLDGQYGFSMAAGNDYTVTPVLDENPVNGVTTYDMVLIMRHILTVQLLDSPYKIIAADANNSGSVTTLDLVAIRKVVLVVEDQFPNNTSWRFVDKDYAFPNPQNPWAGANGFPEVINYNNLTVSDLSAHFVAVKVGDVNGTAATNLQGGFEERNLSGELVFHTQDMILKEGRTYTVPFYGDEQSVSGFQFTLEMDESIELLGVGEGLVREENYGLALLPEGALTMSWNEALPRRLGSEEELFSLLIRARWHTTLGEAMHISSRFTRAEAYAEDESMLDVQLAFNNQLTNDFALYQNVPNPFTGQTRIGFRLPEPTAATLTITDASGKVVRIIEGDYQAGYHELTLRDLGGVSGVLYCRLDTPTHTATRKMVVLD